MTALNDKDAPTMKNLNISYNSLAQPPKDDTMYFNEENSELLASREFVDNLCAFMAKDELLNHIDLSGMNLSNE